MGQAVLVERPRHPAIGRCTALIVAAIVLGSAMTGCNRWPGQLYGSDAHLRNNPFDQAIAPGQWKELSKIAPERLLKRIPTGSPVADMRRYLESMGATFEHAPGGQIACRYSQFDFLAVRGFIGDRWRGYTYCDFTTRTRQNRGAVAEVTLCYSVTNERQHGPTITGGHIHLRKSKFKPCA